MRFPLSCKNHRRRDERDDFVCRRCRRPVNAESYGTRHRNHCPHCLWSLHLDNTPGDRMSACGASMEPIAVWVRQDGEWAIVHRCESCGHLRTNRVAGDDNPWTMMSLAAKPLAQPPFPLV
ncbi:MAG: RNHCP domain-containing protein [Anaerolineae bacterium]|nr:RNHCP domain-containing protein [Phycisphaerae bacterium]